jgi:hypothetical protein
MRLPSLAPEPSTSSSHAAAGNPTDASSKPDQNEHADKDLEQVEQSAAHSKPDSDAHADTDEHADDRTTIDREGKGGDSGAANSVAIQPAKASPWGWGLNLEAGYALMTDIHYVNLGSFGLGAFRFQAGVVVIF